MKRLILATIVAAMAYLAALVLTGERSICMTGSEKLFTGCSAR